MILEQGDMWQVFNRTDLFCLTTNSTIKKNGKLVMGKGIALQAKNRLLDIDLYLAQKITHFSRYGLVVINNFKPQLVGAFQTKTNWQEDSSLTLIWYSVKKLNEYIVAFNPNRVDMPFPGIGNGKLRENAVYPLLTCLPDNVHVWGYF